jgi:DNA-binding transcriptional LysR family regulator
MPEKWPDLEVLALLTTVAELGSVGAAAEKLGVSQPSASTSITRWERRLGLKLLERSTRGSVLTPDGALYVDWSREVLSAAQRMQLATAALQSARSAHLRVAASMTVAEYLVPKWLGMFRRAHPTVTVRLAVLNSDQVMEQIRAGQHEMGFIETTSQVRGLRTLTLCRDELVVVVPSAHPWARRSTPLAARTMAATPLVQREDGSGTRRTFLDACRAAGLEPVEPAQSLASNTAVRVAAIAGTGPAVLSAMAVKDAIASGELVSVPMVGIDLHRPIRAVWSGSIATSGAAVDFLALTRNKQ